MTRQLQIPVVFLVAVAVAANSALAVQKERGQAKSAGTMAAAPPDEIASVVERPARAAADFLDTVGVCTHLGRVQTPYVQRFAEVEKCLLDLGIRHVRTDPLRSKEGYRNAAELGRKGIRFHVTVHGSGDLKEVAKQIDEIKRTIAPYVVDIAGFNEPDISYKRTPPGKERKPADWVPGSRAWMAEVQRLVKAEPALKHVHVVGSAPAYPQRASAQMGDWSDLVDLGNMHSYAGGKAPEERLPQFLEWIKPLYPGVPVLASETGYHTALNNPPKGHKPASLAAEAVYMPRLHMEYFRVGVPWVYKFQLVDDLTEEDCKRQGAPLQEAHFGYIDYQLKPKPAYDAMKNLMHILGDDPQPGFRPHSLAYGVQGAAGEVRQVLLQKSNGDFYLALWRAVSIWDENKRSEIPVDAKTVEVQFAEPPRTVQVYQPTQSSQPLKKVEGVKRLPVPLTGELVLLQIAAPR